MSQPEILRWDQAYNRNGDRKLQRTVVNAIRTYMNNHTLTGWVKAETLVRDTGIKERTLREQIAANIAAGWLEIVESGNSTGKANTYRLTYPNHAPERRVQVEPDHAPQHMVEGESCATAHGPRSLGIGRLQQPRIWNNYGVQPCATAQGLRGCATAHGPGERVPIQPVLRRPGALRMRHVQTRITTTTGSPGVQPGLSSSLGTAAAAPPTARGEHK